MDKERERKRKWGSNHTYISFDRNNLTAGVSCTKWSFALCIFLAYLVNFFLLLFFRPFIIDTSFRSPSTFHFHSHIFFLLVPLQKMRLEKELRRSLEFKNYNQNHGQTIS